MTVRPDEPTTQEPAEELVFSELHREAQAIAVLENIGDAIITLDGKCRVIDLNRAAHSLFGYQDEDILGQDIHQLLPDLPSPDQIPATPDHELPSCLELTAKHRSGKKFPIALTLSRVHSDWGSFGVLIARDLTAQRAAEELLYREKELAQITLQSIQEAVVTTDARGRVNSVNQAACHLLRRDEEDLTDRPLTDLLAFSALEHRRAARDGLQTVLQRGESVQLEGQPEIRFNNGDRIFLKGRLAPLRAADRSIVGCVMVMQDVTSETRMREILSWQATHDDLTSLINRREFERRLQEMIEQRRGDTRHVLLYLDLDQFKLINDNCGHDAGDQLLRQLTSRLGTRLRDSDTLARLGGDEFAVLLPHCSVEDGRRIADDLRGIVRSFRFEWEGRTFGVGVSIGLVALDEQILSITDALSAADSACYIAKEKGRDQLVVYQPSGDEEQRRREEMSQTALIREALETGRFCLWTQPIVPIQGRPGDWSIEILVRMLGEDGNIIAPGCFIPGAERYHLMTHIDRWVLHALCVRWRDDPALFAPIDKIAVNLSGQSIANDEFLEFAIDTVEGFGLPWEKLCFEITETAAVSSIEKARHFIRSLKARKARFALDDFGSGLSSFAYLKQLPVDYLKIDGAFVKDMEHDPIDAAMVRSISDIGRAMNLQTIAEFVENEQVVGMLRDAGVHYAQGYGICRPMPLEQLTEFQPTSVRATAG
ncbi:MAG: EAL domain-containing protein [Gammaproteobacteria bacterium]|nr:MAG: EAL domain-containing protein [Gammaproteobacteria bacterium]